MKILFVTPEALPFVKVGGLGDVSAALPRALRGRGHDVRLMLPDYAQGSHARPSTSREIWSKDIWLGGESHRAAVLETRLPAGGIAYLVQNSEFFNRPGVYIDPETRDDWPDNFQRYLFFQKAALEFLLDSDWQPELLHVNDHQTALIPALLREHYAFTLIGGLRTVLTIHNLGYQGVYPRELFDLTALPDHLMYPLAALEYHGQMNSLKCGIAYADRITTVSPAYAREIREPNLGCGLDTVLEQHAGRLSGILNGIDTDEWNPAADRLLPARYSAANLAGKARCKKSLLRQAKLPAKSANRPLIGSVGRLVSQKGWELLKDLETVLPSIPANFVFLGTGDSFYELTLRRWRKKFPSQVGIFLDNDNALAHGIEAGADLFLMPSRYEPCGLNQMYSLRYGTPPIVHATGGLADTVTDYHRGRNGNGFAFSAFDADALLGAITRALDVYSRPADWQSLVKRVMKTDWSWQASAAKYEALYESLLPAAQSATS